MGMNSLRDFIGVALIFAFVISIPLLIYKSIPQSNEQLIAYMLGQLSGFVSAIVAFPYVTKSGERELDQQRAANTGKAFEAVNKALESTPPPTGEPQPVTVVNPPEDPVNVEEQKV